MNSISDISNKKFYCFDNVDSLNDYFISHLSSILQDAIDKRGHAYLVVPGGTSPKKLFNGLSQINLDWEHVTITLTDERCVSPLAEESNEKRVKDNLLKNVASKADFVSLATEKTISQLPTFDAVILGVGEDGHTASLFPCAQEINVGLSDHTTQATLLMTPSSAPYQRISMTKKRLLNSRVLFFYLVGEKKYDVIKKGIEQNNPLAMPVCAFLHAKDVNIKIMYAR